MVGLRALDVIGRSTCPDWRMGFLSMSFSCYLHVNGPNEGPVQTQYTANAYVAQSPRKNNEAGIRRVMV
jgi:hypothetical protein